MTVSNVIPTVNEYNGDGVTTVFNFTFQVMDYSTDLFVNIITNGSPSTATGYTVTLNTPLTLPSTGYITFAVAPLTGTQVRINRNTYEARVTNYVAGPIQPNTLNADIDNTVLMIQDVDSQLIPQDGAGNYNLGSAIIRNSGAPLTTTDLVTLGYVGTYVAGQITGLTGSGNTVNWYNIVKYGADPTGVADSTTAINAAITAALAVKGTVYIPPGTYKATGQILQAGQISVVGDSMVGSVINSTYNSTTNGNWVLSGTYRYSRYENFTFNGPGQAVSGGAIGFYASGAADSSVQIEWHKVCVSGFNGDGFKIANSFGCRWVQCRIVSNGVVGTAASNTDYSGGGSGGGIHLFMNTSGPGSWTSECSTGNNFIDTYFGGNQYGIYCDQTTLGVGSLTTRVVHFFVANCFFESHYIGIFAPGIAPSGIGWSLDMELSCIYFEANLFAGAIVGQGTDIECYQNSRTATSYTAANGPDGIVWMQGSYNRLNVSQQLNNTASTTFNQMACNNGVTLTLNPSSYTGLLVNQSANTAGIEVLSDASHIAKVYVKSANNANNWNFIANTNGSGGIYEGNSGNTVIGYTPTTITLGYATTISAGGLAVSGVLAVTTSTASAITITGSANPGVNITSSGGSNNPSIKFGTNDATNSASISDITNSVTLAQFVANNGLSTIFSALKLSGNFAANGATPAAANTGYGTPTNAAVQGSFDATTITLINLAKAVAQLIIDLKATGLIKA